MSSRGEIRRRLVLAGMLTLLPVGVLHAESNLLADNLKDWTLFW